VEDRSSFEAWYRAEHPRLIAALFVVSGDADVAQEATDEAFARALARWPRVGAMASPGAWTYRVALNVLRRTFRRRRIETQLLRRQATIAQLDRPVLPEVWQAVAQLPERHLPSPVVPNGWKPVDDNDARVYVPPNWKGLPVQDRAVPLECRQVRPSRHSKRQFPLPPASDCRL
jgi:hypothetical protein